MAYFSKRQKAQMRARRKRKAAAAPAASSNFAAILGGSYPAHADDDAAAGDGDGDAGDDRDADGGGGEHHANDTSPEGTAATRAAAPSSSVASNDRGDDGGVAAAGGDADDGAAAPEVGAGGKRKLVGTTGGGGGGGDRRVRIRVPPGLDGRELKKFRKDRRRKVRKQNPGIRDGHIVFVASSDWKDDVEEEVHQSDDANDATKAGVGEADDQLQNRDRGGTGEEEDDWTEARAQQPPHDRKRRKIIAFPRINEILAAQKAAEKAEREKAERKKSYDAVPADERARYVAVDCEMVGVGAGGKRSALARASLVDWDGNVILDTFVTVPERVTDFRTFVSGVRAKDIRRPTTGRNGGGGDGGGGDDNGGSGGAPGTMELHECRDIVGNALKDRILVGHALKNDLQALLLDHPRRDVRDTARYRPYMRVGGRGGGKYKPRKLRDLAKERLGMTIQVRGESHSSVDDAVAAMELYKLERVRWEKELALKHQRKK